MGLCESAAPNNVCQFTNPVQLQKRFSRDRRNGEPKAYNRRSILQDRGYDHSDANQAWHDSDQGRYDDNGGYAGRYDDMDDGALVRQGAYSSGMSERTPEMAMAHPYAATTYAAYPVGQASSQTRDLTNGGVYTTYADFDDDIPDPYPHNGSLYDHTGRDSPTDYYGHAMSSANTDMMIAAQYGDGGFSEDGHGGHAIGQAIASPYVGAMAITNGELATAQRVPINVNGNGPQIPPFSPVGSPHLFDSGLYADDQQSQGAKELSRKSSQAAPKTSTGEELLRQEYRDLARAAQVDEPTTPTTAALVAAGGFPLPRSVSPKLAPQSDDSRMIPLTPMPMPERYRHGQPLTTLEEVPTPASKIQPLGSVEVDPFSDIPMLLPPARSSAESLALPLPRPGQPRIGGSTDTQSTGSYTSAVSQNAFSLDPMHPPFALSSPGLSLPESPASFADPGRYLSPFARPSVPSAVSLLVPSPNDGHQTRHQTSLDAGWAPASGERLAHAAGLKANPTSRPDHTRSLSTATNVDDAYDGI